MALYPIFIVAAVIALDQIIKNVLVRALADGPITVIKNFFYLIYVFYFVFYIFDS